MNGSTLMILPAHSHNPCILSPLSVYSGSVELTSHLIMKAIFWPNFRRICSSQSTTLLSFRTRVIERVYDLSQMCLDNNLLSHEFQWVHTYTISEVQEKNPLNTPHTLHHHWEVTESWVWFGHDQIWMISKCLWLWKVIFNSHSQIQ
jgi:hypothetical protein